METNTPSTPAPHDPTSPTRPDVPWITDADVRRTYGLDVSHGASVPEEFEVVRARDEADVVEVMRYAAATGTPVVPQVY